MIFRRLRARAGSVLLGLLALGSLTGAAQTVAYVTRSEMEAYVWGVLLSAGAGTVLVGGGFIAWLLQRDRTLQQASIDLVVAATGKLAGQIESLDGKLDGLIRDHDRINGACPRTTWDGTERRARGRQ